MPQDRPLDSAADDALAPFLFPSARPFGLPPFDAIPAERYPAAIRAGIALHEAELAAIAAEAAPPDFANTLFALERSGRPLRRAVAAFGTLAGCCSDPRVRAAEREIAPLLAGHEARRWSDADLSARVEAVIADADRLGLDAEERRLAELHRERSVRSGARLGAAERARLGEIMEELASLGARFSQNVLADEAGWAMALSEADLADLPDELAASARAAGAERGAPGPVVTLSRSMVEPFLRGCPRRDLRETLFRAWASRGTGGGAGGAEADNRPLIRRILALRAERARLLGFESFAAYRLAPQMAGTPEAARALLDRILAAARPVAEAEHEALSALAGAEGLDGPLEPWDWRFLAERRTRAASGPNDSEIKPHLPLDRVVAAAFDCAERLFGVSFAPIGDVPLHHPDARAWEARKDGRFLGVFVGDWLARPSKRSGAWMSVLRPQENMDGGSDAARPVVLNVASFARGGETALLSWDDARTVFHEFGHALHGLLSDVRFPFLSGTNVARDFVELPSQLFENWLAQPEVLERHARHHRTGAPMQRDLIDRLLRSETGGQGFATAEYLASAIVELELHRLADPSGVDPEAFEASTFAGAGFPRAIPPRHALPHFLHVFAGEGYAAGYYSYLWSEVMDADAFAAFEAAGDPFDAATAARFAEHVLSAGGRRDPAEAWRAFRGRDPDPAALLRRRGLASPAG